VPSSADAAVAAGPWTLNNTREVTDEGQVDASGQVTNWNLELASPNVLVRNGWKRTSLQVGDEISVNGFQAKDGSNMANARTVLLADGRRVFAMSSAGSQQ
jgi:hypothetical protein